VYAGEVTFSLAKNVQAIAFADLSKVFGSLKLCLCPVSNRGACSKADDEIFLRTRLSKKAVDGRQSSEDVQYKKVSPTVILPSVEILLDILSPIVRSETP
jgi:hypothetical protein